MWGTIYNTKHQRGWEEKKQASVPHLAEVVLFDYDLAGFVNSRSHSEQR